MKEQDYNKKHFAFLGGSFDPLHNGHIALVDYIIEKNFFDLLWIVPVASPPHKQKSFFSYEKRFLFMQKVFSQERYQNKILVSDIEKHLPAPQYTYHSMRVLQKQYSAKWSLVMGEDSFLSLPRWENAEELAENYSIYVAQRKHKELKFPQLNFVEPPVLLYNPHWNISSSEIKKQLIFQMQHSDLTFRKKVIENLKEKISSLIFEDVISSLC